MKVLCLEGSNKKKMLIYPFCFSYTKDVGGKKFYGIRFFKLFDNVYYVSNNKKTPGFLDGVTFCGISGSLEFGFGLKKKNFPSYL